MAMTSVSFRAPFHNFGQRIFCRVDRRDVRESIDLVFEIRAGHAPMDRETEGLLAPFQYDWLAHGGGIVMSMRAPS